MNIARTICTIRNQNIGRSFVRKLRISATTHESQTTQPQVQEDKFDFEDLKVLERTERRKPKIPSFMKNVFVSDFNKKMLAFPEILDKEESGALAQRISNLETVFSNEKASQKDRIDALKRLDMFAAPASLTNGGLAMTHTEGLHYLEVISSDIQLGQLVSDHWVCLDALKHGLTSVDYQKVIGELGSGKSSIGLCIKEKVSERIAQADFRTKAELDGRGIWRVSGEKLCFHSDSYMLVLCAAEADTLKAFLVEPHANGVSRNGVFVTFLKTPGTPLDQVSNEKLAQLLSISRLHTAALCRSSLTRAVKPCAQYVHERTFSGKPLTELSTIKATFGQVLLTIYGSESAEYFTAGLLDGYEEPDAELETAMCRNFMATNGLTTLLKLLSIPALEMPEETSRYLNEMKHLVWQGETLDSVNMFIALSGIHHAGKMMSEEIRQIRNPLFNPTFILKKVFAERHQQKDNPKLTLYLAEDLHPSLRQSAEQLEYCVMRMKYASETLMARHGQEITKAYTELNRLAEAATEILIMTAVLARASRAYCIGLRNAEVEMKLAGCFVEISKDRVRKLILEIDDGEFLNLDYFKIQFGKKMLDSNTLLVEKPTARVFW